VSRRTTAEKNAARRNRLAAEAQSAATPQRYTVTFSRATPAATPVPYKSIEREAFDAAYGDRPITPEAAYWDARGIMRWQLATHYAGSRLAFNRNHPNG
jgi:hypothetical protein